MNSPELSIENVQDSKTQVPKIVHVVISMVMGGAERLVYDMVRYPAFADNPPTVCCMDAIGELGEKLIQEGYKVHYKNRRPGLDFGMIAWLRDIIKQEKADVVHAHQYSPLFYAVPAALVGGARVVYTEHGRFYPDRKSWKRSLFNPLLELGAHRLVSISHATAQAMAKYDNFPLRRIQVIHNGIDTSNFNRPVDKVAKRRELGLNQVGKIIGTAARLNSIKNIDMMLRVMKLILEKHPDSYLVIAGQGEERERLEAMAVDLGISDNVKFIGLRFDLAEVYQLFDVFLLTSFSEGISVTLLEAMASGVPAVVTDVGGNGEVVVEGETGFLTPLNSDEIMASKIERFLCDVVYQKEIGLNAKKRIHTHFSIKSMLEAYWNSYT